MDRQKWLEERRTYVGASEIAALCGLGPKKPIEVWQAKLGLIDEAENDDCLSVFGREFEPVLFAKYEQMTGCKVEPVGVVRHPEFPVVACNPDRAIVGTNRLLEGKTYGFKQADEWGEPNSDQVPLKYRVQALVQMECTGAEAVEFIAFRRETCEYTLYTVARDPENGARLVAAGVKFWDERVLANEPPPPDESEAYKHYLNRKYPRVIRESIAATAAQDKKIASATYLHAQVKAFTKQLAQIKNELRAEMGDAGRLVSIHGDVALYEVKRNGKTTKALRLPQENGDE